MIITVLKDKIFIIFIMFWNPRICKSYDEIADKVSRQPASTAELVEITEFLNQSIDSTIYKLEFKINEAKRRLLFLLDYAIMPSMPLKTFLYLSLSHWQVVI